MNAVTLAETGTALIAEVFSTLCIKRLFNDLYCEAI